MSTESNLTICHRCDRLARPCAGACICTADGRDIVDHAQAGDCPLARYPSRGLGDTVAKVTHATGIHALVQTAARAVGKPCGCAKRREALNKLLPYEQRNVGAD